jgi:hypothetical protein
MLRVRWRSDRMVAVVVYAKYVYGERGVFASCMRWSLCKIKHGETAEELVERCRHVRRASFPTIGVSAISETTAISARDHSLSSLHT